MVFVAGGSRMINPMALVSADTETLFGAQKAETFTTEWMLADSVVTGSPLFASSGDLIGFATGDTSAFGLHHSRGFVQDVVRTGAVRGAVLGLYVADLSRLSNVTEDVRGGRYSGALVIAPSTLTSAIVKGGPADKAGILVRDIILDVDGESVSAQQSLAEILSLYEPGEIANMRISRGGQIVDVAVTLGELKDLVY